MKHKKRGIKGRVGRPGNAERGQERGGRNLDMGMEHYAYVSPLRHKNACLKTTFGITVLVCGLAMDSIAVSLWIMVSMMGISVIWGKVRLYDYIRFLAMPLFFILFGGGALFFATEDMWLVLLVTLRAVGAVSAFYFLTLSTPVGELMAVLRKCHVPPVLIGLMYLLYRDIFVLTGVWQSMFTAAQSRLGYADYRTSLRTFGGIGSNLLLLSWKRADDCYHAMEARGYEGTICFLERRQSCRWYDVLAAAGYIAVMAAIRRFCG